MPASGPGGVGLQIADYLCRGYQTSPDVGIKLIAVLTFKMFAEVLQVCIVNRILAQHPVVQGFAIE